MIIDRLENLGKYESLHPLIKEVITFLDQTDIKTCETGKKCLKGTDLFVNLVYSEPKEKGEAKIETHNAYIDIQLPISATEIMGYSPRIGLPEVPYDNDNDISFYEGEAENYFTVKPGMFVIFFPEDGHAPAITPIRMKKAIFKLTI